MRAADRIRLPVPLDQIPTVYPTRKFRPIRPTVSAFRRFLWRWRDRLPARSAFEAYGYCDWWSRESFHQLVNPATGLPMVGGVDTAGNPFGSSFHRSFDTVVSDLPSLPSDLEGDWDDTFRRCDPDHGFDPTHARGFY